MTDEQLLDLARERFRRAVDAERENRQEAKIDLQFIAGDQWDPAIKRAREIGPHRRPCLVFQKLTGPVAQVSNEARQNRPAIKTVPIDGGASKPTSDVIEGMIRHITTHTHGDVAGEIAVDAAVRSGFGFLGLITQFEEPDNPENWNQELAFRSFQNQFAVYLDPDAKQPDKSDANFGFVLERYTRKEFEAKYPDSKVGSQYAFFDYGDNLAPDWVGGDDVLVAEYWYAEEEYKTITRGKVTRQLCSRKIWQCVINGVEVLEEATEWLGKRIPIFPVYGPEIAMGDGIVKRESLIRHARDPQQLHNFYKSVEAETVALAPRPKWIGAVGQFKSDKNWNNANLSNVAKLEYDPVSSNGNLVGRPEWITFDPPVQSLTVGALQTADDIKSATNIFDASLGARSNETSGKAIDARKYESDMANSHFLDNLARAYTSLGEEMVVLIPKIYDTPREVLVVGEDDAKKVVMVNAPFQEPGSNKVTTHMLDAGKYGVVVTTGPDYTTKRKESFELFSDLSKAWPPLMQNAGDLIIRNSDIPGADAIADRLKAALPPGLQQMGSDNEIPPAAQAKIVQQAQMIDQLSQAVHQLSQKLETKAVEGEIRVRVALINARAGVLEAWIRAESDAAKTAFMAEIDQIDRQLAMLPQPGADASAPQQGQQPQQPLAA